jgi:geranylgeranyl diphosphate synthase type II
MSANMTIADITTVEECLKTALRKQVQQADKVDASYGELWRVMSALIGRGGKRIRPQLVLLSYQAYGGTETAKISVVAASQELFHAFLLMHDDIIDRDLRRWGGPNISGTYFDQFQRQDIAKARHFADSYALLAGDACYGLANTLLLNSGLADSHIVKASQLLQQTLQLVIGGELLDVSATVTPSKFSRHQLLQISRYKTASYSFVTPLQLGALFAGANALILDKLALIGTDLGIAFQLRDDLLGMFGNEATTGKPAISDLREGKQTLLTYEAYAKADAAHKATLDRLLGKSTATPADLATMRHLLIATGAQASVERACLSYARKAQTAIAKLDIAAPARQTLINVALFATQRVY